MINIFKDKINPFSKNGNAKKINGTTIENVNQQQKPTSSAPVQKFQILTHKRDLHKLLMFGWLLTTFFLSAVIVYLFSGFNSALAAKESQMFVVKDGKVYEAQKDESFSRSDIEIDMFVNTWLSNAFSYDKNSYEDRINMALEWMDQEGADAFYRGTQKSNTLNRLNNYNANTAVSIDSISIDRTSEGAKATAFFAWKTYIAGDLNSASNYKLITGVKPVRRTSKHPYAMILTDTEYRKIETQQ